MFRRLLCVSMIVLGLALQASAEITLVLTDAGYQVMTTGPNGATLTPVARIDRVIDDRTGSPPLPGPGPGPVPPADLSPTATKVKQLAEAVGDAEGAQALTIVYREVGNEQGLNSDQVKAALRMASDEVLGDSGTKTKAKWTGFRSEVSKMFTDIEARGGTSDDYRALCLDIANGLEASSPAGVLTPELLQLIIELVLRIIALFTGGGGGV